MLLPPHYRPRQVAHDGRSAVYDTTWGSGGSHGCQDAVFQIIRGNVCTAAKARMHEAGLRLVRYLVINEMLPVFHIPAATILDLALATTGSPCLPAGPSG